MELFLERLAPFWTPHPGQREFLLAPSPIRVLACGRRWGKTDACAVDLLAAMHRPSPCRHLVLAPTADQARLLFDRVLSLLEHLSAQEGSAKVVSRVSPYPRLEYGEHRLQARSGHVGRSLRGNEATHIVVDEAAYVPESLVTEVAMPMLATTQGRLTLISTPRGHNGFWRFFRMGETGRHGVWSRRAPSWESPLVSQAYLDVQKEMMSERAFAVEYGAEFRDDAGTVFRKELVDASLVAHPPEPAPPFTVGVDWARYGDWTAAVVLSGCRHRAELVETLRVQGEAWTTSVDRVARMLERYPSSRVVCDATGVGDPLLEMLRARVQRCSVEGVVFTPATKSGLVDGLVWAFERKALRLYPEPDLLRELEQFEAIPTERGLKLSARGGAHDDLVCALALAVSGLPAGRQAGVTLLGLRA